MIKFQKDYLLMTKEESSSNIFRENIKSALESANETRQHDMSKVSQSSNRVIYQCTKCSMQLEVIAKPLPNEAFSTGEAIALVCTGET